MTTIPALQKDVARLYADLAQAKASIRELTARVDNKPISVAVGTAAAPTTIHGSLAGLGIDDHLQYIHISNARTITAQHDFAPGSAQAPFTLGVNAQGELVTGLNADEVDGFSLDQDVLIASSPTFAGLTMTGNIGLGGGDTVDGVDVSAHAADANAHHDAVTLAADAGAILGLTGQQITVDSQLANQVLAGPSTGAPADPDFRALVLSDIPTHDIVGSLHSVGGSALDVVGLSATNTLGVLSPSADPGAVASLLKTTAAGLLTLEDLNITDDLNVGSGVLLANGSSNIVGINKTPVAGYDLDINATLRAGGLATLASLSVTGAATFGDDLTVGANILFVDYSGQRIGIKRAADPQFQLDILGNLRASGWIVGKHAVQLEGAVGIFHFDGREPYESDYTGVSTGHKGQKPTTETAIIYRFGKFGKAIQSAVATTNLVINSSWEDGLTSWSALGSPPTEAVVTTESYYGGSSFHLVTDADDQGRYQPITVVDGQVYNASVYVKIESGQIALRARTGTSSYTHVESDVAWAGDGEWHRMHLRFTPVGTASQVYVGRVSGYGSSGEYYIDACQLEQYGSITPYCDGSLGSGHSFSGADHASTSSRVASILGYSPELAKPGRGTLMCWAKLGGDATHSVTYECVVQFIATTGSMSLTVSAGSALTRLYDGGGVGPSSYGSVIDDGEWHHVALTWDGTTALLYLDGVLDITFSYDSFSGSMTSIYLGTSGAAQYLNGWIDEVAFLDRIASADEIISIYESDAPVFAETSTFEWSTPSITTWVDEEGLWSRGAVTGQEVFGISDVNSKSWAGITMDEGDVIIGNSPNFLLWDDSNSRLIVTGKILATQGNMIGGSIFSESFQDSSAIEDWYDWYPTPAAELSVASGGVFGGSHLVIGNNSGNDQAVLAHIVNVPYDPTKTYKVSFRVRRTFGTGVVYLGLMGVGADGITLVNKSGVDSIGSQHYICAVNATPSSSWTVYDGYIAGNAATGSDGTPGDPTSPGTLHEDATYIRAMGYFNHNGVAGTMEVDAVTIEVVPEGDDLTSIDGGRLVNYSVDTTQLTATAIDGMTITGTTIRTSSSGARVEMNSTRIFGTDGSDTQWEALNSTGKLTAGAGNVVLDEDGISVELAGYAPGGQRAYSFTDVAASVVGEISGVGAPGTGHSIDLYSLSLAGEDSDIGLWATSPATNAASIILQASNVTGYNRITMSTTRTTFTDDITISSGEIVLGADVQLSRGGANLLYTPDSLTIDGTLKVDTIDNNLTGTVSITANVDIPTGTLTVNTIDDTGAGTISITSNVDIPTGTLTVNTLDDTGAGAIAVNTGVDITGALTVSGSLGGTWTGLSFGTSWSSFGGGHQACQYKKVGDLVFVRGLADSGAGAWITYPTLGTLPSGYRPSSTVMISTMCEGVKTTQINISTVGVISIVNHDGGVGSGWINLNGIVFSVD